MTPPKGGDFLRVTAAAPPVERVSPVQMSASRYRRAGTVMAQARLRSELRSIAWDVLGSGDSKDLPPDMADWVSRASEAAVAAACDRALDTLLTSIDQTMAAAPPSVVAGLERVAVHLDAGVD